MLKVEAEKAGKNHTDFEISVVAVPQLSIRRLNSDERSFFTGTLEQIEKDAQEIKRIGVDRLIIRAMAGEGYNLDKYIKVAKEISSFCKWT